jgi:hypothetical protein
VGLPVEALLQLGWMGVTGGAGLEEEEEPEPQESRKNAPITMPAQQKQRRWAEFAAMSKTD